MQSKANTIQVEVAYLGVNSQASIAVVVTVGSTVRECILASKILNLFEELGSDVEAVSERVGIYGQIVNLDKTVRKGDRIEIYRPLPRDPKEARRERVRAQVKENRRKGAGEWRNLN